MATGSEFVVLADADGTEIAYNLDDVVCNVCGSGEQEDLMLLCDGCPHSAQHIFCCSPPRKTVPGEDEDWFCNECIRLDRPKMIALPREEEESKPKKMKRSLKAASEDDNDVKRIPLKSTKSGRQIKHVIRKGFTSVDEVNGDVFDDAVGNRDASGSESGLGDLFTYEHGVSEATDDNSRSLSSSFINETCDDTPSFKRLSRSVFRLIQKQWDAKMAQCPSIPIQTYDPMPKHIKSFSSMNFESESDWITTVPPTVHELHDEADQYTDTRSLTVRLMGLAATKGPSRVTIEARQAKMINLSSSSSYKSDTMCYALHAAASVCAVCLLDEVGDIQNQDDTVKYNEQYLVVTTRNQVQLWLLHANMWTNDSSPKLLYAVNFENRQASSKHTASTNSSPSSIKMVQCLSLSRQREGNMNGSLALCSAVCEDGTNILFALPSEAQIREISLLSEDFPILSISNLPHCVLRCPSPPVHTRTNSPSLSMNAESIHITCAAWKNSCDKGSKSGNHSIYLACGLAEGTTVVFDVCPSLPFLTTISGTITKKQSTASQNMNPVLTGDTHADANEARPKIRACMCVAMDPTTGLSSASGSVTSIESCHTYGHENDGDTFAFISCYSDGHVCLWNPQLVPTTEMKTSHPPIQSYRPLRIWKVETHNKGHDGSGFAWSASALDACSVWPNLGHVYLGASDGTAISVIECSPSSKKNVELINASPEEVGVIQTLCCPVSNRVGAVLGLCAYNDNKSEDPAGSLLFCAQANGRVQVLSPAVATATGPLRESVNRLNPFSAFGATLAIVKAWGGSRDSIDVKLFVNGLQEREEEKEKEGKGQGVKDGLLVGRNPNLVVEMPSWNASATCIHANWLSLPTKRASDGSQKGQGKDQSGCGAHIVVYGNACGLVCVQLLPDLTDLFVSGCN